MDCRSVVSRISTVRRRLSLWWATRLFGGERECPASFASLLPPVCLALLASLLFFARLGCPLLEPEEARYAEIPRQMLAEGRFLTPVLHGEDYYQKPPLLYWLVMACYQVFGVHDWAARLVPATAGVFIVLVIYGWARCTVGPRAALASGLILCLSARFLYLGGMVAMDSLLCLWVIGGLASAHVALIGPGELSRRWWVLSALCCGLGMLTKGPVAAVLIAGPLACFMILEARRARVTFRAWLCYLGIAGMVAAPWYVALSLRDPQATGSFFWLHNIVRYLAPFDHEKPAWFYLPGLVVGMLPWTLLLVPLVPFLLRGGERWARRRPPALGFFLVSFLWCLLFFSFSGCKRAGYILPALPALAAILGTYLTRAFPWRYWARVARPRLCPDVTRLGHVLGRWSIVVVIQAGLVLAWVAVAWDWWPWAPVLALSALGNGSCLWIGMSRSPLSVRGLWLTSVTLTAMLLVLTAHSLLPNYHRRFGLRGQVRRHFEQAQDLRVVCYPKRWDSVSFYLQRPADLPENLNQFVVNEPALLFIKRGFLDELPAGLEFIPCGRQGGNVLVGLMKRKHASPKREQEALAGASGW